MELDTPTLKYITKLACQNLISASGRNWRDWVDLSKNIGMNVKQLNIEWYDTVCNEDINNVCILREMIEVSEKWAECHICNTGDVDFN